MHTIRTAMEYAYRAQGVVDWTEADGVYTSAVQHSSGATKRLRDAANAYLARHKSSEVVVMHRNSAGLAMYSIS